MKNFLLIICLLGLSLVTEVRAQETILSDTIIVAYYGDNDYIYVEQRYTIPSDEYAAIGIVTYRKEHDHPLDQDKLGVKYMEFESGTSIRKIKVPHLADIDKLFVWSTLVSSTDTIAGGPFLLDVRPGPKRPALMVHKPNMTLDGHQMSFWYGSGNTKATIKGYLSYAKNIYIQFYTAEVDGEGVIEHTYDDFIPDTNVSIRYVIENEHGSYTTPLRHFHTRSGKKGPWMEYTKFAAMSNEDIVVYGNIIGYDLPTEVRVLYRKVEGSITDTSAPQHLSGSGIENFSIILQNLEHNTMYEIQTLSKNTNGTYVSEKKYVKTLSNNNLFVKTTLAYAEGLKLHIKGECNVPPEETAYIRAEVSLDSSDFEFAYYKSDEWMVHKSGVISFTFTVNAFHINRPLYVRFFGYVRGGRTLYHPHYLKVVITDPVSIAPSPSLNDLLAYPNPATTSFNLEADNTDRILALYNMQGQEVRTQDLYPGTNTIHVIDLPRGIYFYRVDGSSPKKIVLN